LHFLVVATAWGSRHGGINSFNVSLCEALREAGQLVTCLVVDATPNDIQAAAESGVKLIGTESGPGLSEFPQQRLLLAPPELTESIDYVIGHGRITGPQAFQLRRLRFPQAAYVHFVHMHADTIDGEKQPPTRHELTEARMRAEHDLLEKSALAVAVGPRLAALYTPEFATRCPGRTIHGFVPGLGGLSSLVGGASSTHDTQLILIVARPEDKKLKGIDHSVERVSAACRSLRGVDLESTLLANRIQLHIIGAESTTVAEAEEQRLRKVLQPVRVKPYAVDRKAIAMEMKAAGLVLMLSTEEGFGLSALEALSVGTPVLVSGRSGFAEVLRLLGTGQEQPYIVDLDGESANTTIEQAIVRILQNLPEHRARIAQLRTAYENAHSWTRAVSDFLRALTPTEASGGESGAAPGTNNSASTGGGGEPEPSEPPEPLIATATDQGAGDFAVAAQLAAISSATLSTIDTESGKAWIPRPEEDELQQKLTSEPSTPIALLGPPGSGKSALVARVARARAASIENGESPSVVLVLKADLLPATVRSVEQLSRHLGLAASLSETVAGIAAFRSVLVFVDQLDALSALVDRHPERLAVILDAVEQLTAISNVSVVFSCRTFEFNFDPRYARLRCTKVELRPLPDAGVTAALTARGVVATGLSERVSNLLRLPEWLMLALDVTPFGTAPSFDSGNALVHAYLERVYARSEDAEAVRRAMDRVAQLIDEREEMWLPTSLAATEGIDVRSLLLLGLVRSTADGRTFSMSHQILFEHLRTAQILTRASLADYVQRRSGSTFVRPLLGPALERLRALDKPRYQQELQGLFGLPGLRAYLRHHLLKFVGSQEEPTEYELQVICEHIENRRWLNWTLQAIAGKPQWFALLKDSQLAPVLRGPLAPALPVLTGALGFDRPAVTDLLKRHVLHRLHDADGSQVGRIITWLLDAWRPWDADAQFFGESLARSAASLGALEPVSLLWHRLLETDPEACISMIGTWLDAHRGDPTKILSELQHWWPTDGMHAKGARALVEIVAPRVVSLLESHEATPNVGRYATLPLLEWETDSEDSLASDLRLALRIVARDQPEAFRAFLARSIGSELMVVHCLLADALAEAASREADYCVEYLSADTRRMRLGTWEPDQTLRLLRAISPHLSKSGMAHITELVASFEFRIPARDNEPDEAQRQAQNVEWRKVYLQALSPAQSSDEANSATDSEKRSHEFRAIGSPISVETLAGLDDDGLLAAFDEFPDSTGWHHPTEWMKGGSIELSRALAGLVATAPERFAALARRFNPATHARPAAEIFSALSKTDLPQEKFEALFIDLNVRKVFADEERASSAAYAVSDRVGQKGAPSEPVVATLIDWLRDAHPTDAEEREQVNDSPKHSLLLRGPNIGTLPGGNYPVLHALTIALTHGPEPQFGRWLDLLERHLKRNETTSVWRALSRNFSWLVRMEPKRGEQFLAALFTKHPNVLASRAGIVLLATIRWNVPLDVLVGWLRDLLVSGWERADQAYGELLACIAFLPEAESELETELAALIKRDAPPERRAGAVHLLAELWDGPHRSRITQYLVQAISIAGEEFVGDALGKLFLQDAFFADKETDQLLQALLANPDLLAMREASFFPEKLLKLLPHEAETIAALVRIYVETRGPQLFYEAGKELIGISLFLQRLGGGHRERGLALLDIMYEHGAREASNFFEAAALLHS